MTNATQTASQPNAAWNDIYEAALGEVRLKGFGGLALEDVAQAAEVELASLERWIPSKAHLLAAMIDQDRLGLAPRTEAACATSKDPGERLEILMNQQIVGGTAYYGADMLRHIHAWTYLERQTVGQATMRWLEQFQLELEHVLESGVECGLLLDHMPTKATAASLRSAYIDIARSHQLVPEVADREGTHGAVNDRVELALLLWRR